MRGAGGSLRPETPSCAGRSLGVAESQEAEMADYATLLRDHVTLTCRCVDRISLQRFAALAAIEPGQLIVNGLDLAIATERERRRAVGYAAQGMLLSRGSILRAARYR